MSRLRIAREIANKTGSSLSNAVSYVNRVGATRARTTLRQAENGVPWTIPATVTAGTGGVYYWREQDVRTAQAIAEEAQADAEQSENELGRVNAILDNDELTGDQKAELLGGYSPGGGGGGGSDDNDPVSWFEDLSGDIGDMVGGTETTLILTIVVVFVLIYGLNSLNPAMRGGVVR